MVLSQNTPTPVVLDPYDFVKTLTFEDGSFPVVGHLRSGNFVQIWTFGDYGDAVECEQTVNAQLLERGLLADSWPKDLKSDECITHF